LLAVVGKEVDKGDMSAIALGSLPQFFKQFLETLNIAFESATNYCFWKFLL
jgi:hypothetical protein